jgi:hypothetical protein
VTLAPAGDSDELSPAWLAHYSGWQRELQSLIGRTVTLDCLGGYAEIVPFGRDARDPRVCLASILWRAL